MAYPTLAMLGTQLGYRLHDSSNGQWGLTELYQYINSAYHRTVIETGCHFSSVSKTLVQGTHTYDCAPLTKVLAVRVGGILKPQTMADMDLISPDWDNRTVSQQVPLYWMPTSGSSIRIDPPPNLPSLGQIETLNRFPAAGGTGYTVDDIVTIDDYVTTPARVRIYNVTNGVASGIILHQDDAGTFYRGYGYTATSGVATTAYDPASGGTGLTVTITSLVTVRAYGPADVDDLGQGMIATLTAAPTAGGTGYTANDLLVVTTGGTGGQVSVDTVSDGVVTAVSLVAAGTGYSVGAGRATVGGTGSGCTVAVATITDGRSLPIDEVPIGPGHQALLLGAEQEARMARPHMTGSLEAAKLCYDLWMVECDNIKRALDN